MEPIKTILGTLHFELLVPDRFRRCHKTSEDWFHATMPSAGEMASLDTNDQKAMLELVDRHLYLSESSFAGQIASVAEMPLPIYFEVARLIFEYGVQARADGSCHA